MSTHHEIINMSFEDTTELCSMVKTWAYRYYNDGIFNGVPEGVPVYTDANMANTNNPNDISFTKHGTHSGIENSILAISGYGIFRFLPTWTKVVNQLVRFGINISQDCPRIVVSQSPRPRRERGWLPVMLNQNLFGADREVTEFYSNQYNDEATDTMIYSDDKIRLIDYTVNYSTRGVTKDDDNTPRAVINLATNDQYNDAKVKLSDLIDH